MSRITIEAFDPKKHRDYMWGEGNVPAKRDRHSRAPTLAQYNVCLLNVCSFTFTFHDIAQLDACLAFFRREHQPTSRLPVHTGDYGGDHTETQRWFERLPQYLLEKSIRPQVLAALEKARALYLKSGGW